MSHYDEPLEDVADEVHETYVRRTSSTCMLLETVAWGFAFLLRFFAFTVWGYVPHWAFIILQTVLVADLVWLVARALRFERDRASAAAIRRNVELEHAAQFEAVMEYAAKELKRIRLLHSGRAVAVRYAFAATYATYGAIGLYLQNNLIKAACFITVLTGLWWCAQKLSCHAHERWYSAILFVDYRKPRSSPEI